MWRTCDHAVYMSKMIQVRNVPDPLHRKLKVRAAEQGVSLSDYILAELRRLSERISPRELAERAALIVREDLKPSPADLLRAERDRRSA
jgi:antitoxin FitA